MEYVQAGPYSHFENINGNFDENYSQINQI